MGYLRNYNRVSSGERLNITTTKTKQPHRKKLTLYDNLIVTHKDIKGEHDLLECILRSRWSRKSVLCRIRQPQCAKRLRYFCLQNERVYVQLYGYIVRNTKRHFNDTHSATTGPTPGPYRPSGRRRTVGLLRPLLPWPVLSGRSENSKNFVKTPPS